MEWEVTSSLIIYISVHWIHTLVVLSVSQGFIGNRQSTAKEAVIGPLINQINHCRAAVPDWEKCPYIWEEQSHIGFAGYRNLITEHLGVKLSFDALPEWIVFIYEDNHLIIIRKESANFPSHLYVKYTEFKWKLK